MAYLAGMIWSVSMLTPNFHALPRNTFGRVMSPPHHVGRSVSRSETGWGRSTRHLRRQVLEHLARVGDHSGHRAGCRHGRVRQVDHRLRVAHAAREVAVGGAQAHLSFSASNSNTSSYSASGSEVTGV